MVVYFKVGCNFNQFRDEISKLYLAKNQVAEFFYSDINLNIERALISGRLVYSNGQEYAEYINGTFQNLECPIDTSNVQGGPFSRAYSDAFKK